MGKTTYRQKIQEDTFSIDSIKEEVEFTLGGRLDDNSLFVDEQTMTKVLDELESKVKDIRVLIESHETLEAIEELKKLEEELY